MLLFVSLGKRARRIELQRCQSIHIRWGHNHSAIVYQMFACNRIRRVLSSEPSNKAVDNVAVLGKPSKTTAKATAQGLNAEILPVTPFCVEHKVGSLSVARCSGLSTLLSSSGITSGT